MILCDVDGVLAIGPRGDTAVGEPIYRTALEPPIELQRIRDAGIPFHVVTAKVEEEARQVLAAVGVAKFVDSVVSADRLFWPSVWGAIRRGRVPGSLSKSTCHGMLPERSDTHVVMIENHLPHLHDMLSAGAVDFGILVPPITVADARMVEWFDLELALRLARKLAGGGVASTELTTLGVSVVGWPDKKPAALNPEDGTARPEPKAYLFRLPRISTAGSAPAGLTLESLGTHHVLRPAKPNVVTAVRSGRQLIRRLVRRLLARTV